jgi:hypothetical protein
MDPLKIIGICNRIKITPPANRKPLVAELVAAIDLHDSGGVQGGSLGREGDASASQGGSVSPSLLTFPNRKAGFPFGSFRLK